MPVPLAQTLVAKSSEIFTSTFTWKVTLVIVNLTCHLVFDWSEPHKYKNGHHAMHEQITLSAMFQWHTLRDRNSI